MSQREILTGIVKTYMDVFGSYEVKSAQLQSEIDKLGEKFNALANQNSDPTVFYKNMMDSGLQEEYSALVTKVAMASMNMADEEGNVKTDYSDEPPRPVVSVKEFVEQYRVPYDEIKKQGYRKRGEAAYEAIFAVAQRTDNMLDAQLIFEKERLMWKIVTEDSLDVFEPILEAMDPLQRATTVTLQTHIAVYKRANSDEELVYLLEKAETYKTIKIEEAVTRMTIAGYFAYFLTEYCVQKNVVFEWYNDRSVQGAVSAMTRLRMALRKLIKFINEEWSISYAELMADEGTKIWFLNPANADLFGRFKTALHPQNYAVFEDIIENEVMKDISITEVLLRQTPAVFWFDLKGDEDNAYIAAAEAKANKANAELTYYQYLEQLNSAGAAYVPQKEQKSSTGKSVAGVKERFNIGGVQEAVKQKKEEGLTQGIAQEAKSRLKGFKFW